jgi:uncharacterized protein (TIGR03086 family)
VTTDDIRGADQRAVLISVDLIARLTDRDLDRPTPCAGWTLRVLLEHMTTQHHGFAAAAAGDGADSAVWQARPAGPDPVAAYTDAAHRVVAAFAVADVLERPFALPEISTKTTFPGSLAIGFHFIDYVVHGWDVAHTLGVPFDLPPDLAATALRIARSVPDGPERHLPGAAFRPGLPVPEGAGPLDEILARLGRSTAQPA